MNVLVACEFSGVVREAFRARGHDAWSCDLLPAEDGSAYHFQQDVRDLLDGVTRPPKTRAIPYGPNGWRIERLDLLIAHPPCTRLTNAGVRWLYKSGKGTERDPQMWADMEAAVKFIGALWSTTIPRVCLENPIMHRHARQRFGFDPTQIIQPWQFGHAESKATCLWLRGLPKLQPTNVLNPPKRADFQLGLLGDDDYSEAYRAWHRVHHASPSPDRWKERSRTLPGIAAAMAEQWGAL